MLFIINKIFIFFSFILKKKLIQFLKLKNYFLYFLIISLVFRPSEALCEEDLITEDKTNSFNKKVIFYSLVCITLLGMGLFFYYYSGNDSYPSDTDYNTELATAKAEEAAAKASLENYYATYKVAKKIAVENWNEAKINYLAMRNNDSFSQEEVYSAMVKLAEAEKVLNAVHIPNQHYLYRPFTERRFVD